MRARIGLVIVSIAVVTVLAAAIVPLCSADKIRLRLDAKSIMDTVCEGDRHSGPKLHALLQQYGDAMIPVLTPYLNDSEWRVRLKATYTLGEIEDARVVPLLARCLRDTNGNVSRYAIDALERFPREVVSKHKRQIADNLALYAREWHQESGKAAILLGDFGAKDKIPDLRWALAEAKTISETDMRDDRYVLVARRKAVLTKVLFKLGDKDAAQAVQGLLKQGDPKKLAQGINAVEFARNPDYVPLLLLLLNDTRDAQRFGVSGTNYYLRVRDLAVNAIASVTGGKFSFQIYRGPHYTDAQAQEVAAFVGKWEKGKR